MWARQLIVLRVSCRIWRLGNYTICRPLANTVGTPYLIWHSFFAGCHLFIPVFDPEYDTYESLMERTPWTSDAILAIASKIRSGTGPLSPTFFKCLEEAQGIARSSLFGPVVRKEAVQGKVHHITICILLTIGQECSSLLHGVRMAGSRVDTRCEWPWILVCTVHWKN
jgi:hypothetical protein